MYVYTHTYTHIYIYIWRHTQLCVSVCAYVHVYKGNSKDKGWPLGEIGYKGCWANSHSAMILSTVNNHMSLKMWPYVGG
jgi:hypothetical protein